MKLGCHTITWGGVVGSPVGVTSVKDLHYRANGSMDDAVASIAAAGYEGVEMFDGNVLDLDARPGGARGLVEEHGLQLVSVYTGGSFVFEEILAEELFRVRGAARLAASAGASTLVVGGGARRHDGTRDIDYDRLGSALDEVDAIAAEHGLDACYHPHLTTIVESPEELARIMSRTSIGFCPDTAHLAAGGGDPAALIRAYGDRIRHVHLKDVRLDPLQFLPLGLGDLDFDDVLRALREVGYDGWLLVELDSFAGDPADAARTSKSFLDRALQRGR